MRFQGAFVYHLFHTENIARTIAAEKVRQNFRKSLIFDPRLDSEFLLRD
jgi:hypothetical protein